MAFAFPAALLSSFGKTGFVSEYFAHFFALLPGLPGNFLRAAYYKLTLENCSPDVVIGFGTFFSRRQVSVAPNVSIGSYCIIGSARIGARTQISSLVQIPGKGQHTRNASGRLSDAPTVELPVVIGEDCWIGASAVVMADVGDRSTIGAGSVVVKPVGPGVVAVGSPAKAIKSSV